MLFPTRELRSVTIAELKCLFAMVHRIKYTPVADIIDYFKEIRTLSRPIMCTSLVTRITLNIGCPEMHKVAYIEGMYLSLIFLTFCTPMFCVKSGLGCGDGTFGDCVFAMEKELRQRPHWHADQLGRKGIEWIRLLGRWAECI
jgi:hypothetical protein